MKYVNYSTLIKLLPKKNKTFLIPQCASIPVNLMNLLAKRQDEFENIQIWCENPMDVPTFRSFKYVSFYNNKYIRDIPNTDYIPVNFAETPDLIRQSKIDVYFSLLSRTIKGKASVGISVDYGPAGIGTAKLVVGIQNNKVPYTLGDGEVDLEVFDYIVKDDFDLPILEDTVGNPITEQIADHIVPEIGDGSVLQVGIGNIPDGILSKLKDKNDLGIHSEMISHQAIELIKNGNVTNKKKQINTGESTVTFVLGRKEDYQYLDQNKNIIFRTVDYTNDPFNIGKNDRVVAINSAIQVDLYGQVNAEALFGNQYTGIGGQVNFVRGARISKGGKSFIALPSTDSTGTYSRIVPHVDVVTTSRNEVDFVCTEYGCVRLSGKTLRERKELLVSIAHPKFREELCS